MRSIKKKHIRDFLGKPVISKAEKPQPSVFVLSIDSSCLEDKHSRYLLRALSSSGNFPSLRKACLQSHRWIITMGLTVSVAPGHRGQVGAYRYYWVVGCGSPGRRKALQLQIICGGLWGKLTDVLRCLTWRL